MAVKNKKFRSSCLLQYGIYILDYLYIHRIANPWFVILHIALHERTLEITKLDTKVDVCTNNLATVYAN